MTDSALCIPPNPSASGWWYMSHDTIPETIAKWEYPTFLFPSGALYLVDGVSASPRQLAKGSYRILGPVPTHAEVEALRAELAKEVARVQNWQTQAIHWERQAQTWAKELVTASRRIERLREDIVALKARWSDERNAT